MRLQLAPVVIFAVGALAATAAADAPVMTSVDTFVYTDTDNVVVVSPQVGAQVAVDDDGGEISARAVVDIVSAASVDVITEATPRFTEMREEADLAASHRLGAWLPSLHYRFSTEPDYLSNGGGAGFERRLGHDTTLSGGYDLTIDRVGRSGTAPDVFSARLVTHTADLSVTQVLGPKTLVRLAWSFVGQDGYMEKPYRYVPLFDDAGIAAAAADGVTLDRHTFGAYRLAARPPEEVPDLRLRQAVALRLLRYLSPIGGSVRLDYRFYLDDWGVRAHTGEIALLAAYGPWTFELSDRAYWQSAASFWRRAYVVAPGTLPRYRSVDRDLGGYVSDLLEVGTTFHAGRLGWYATAGALYTKFTDYMFLDTRLALTFEGGLRVAL